MSQYRIKITTMEDDKKRYQPQFYSFGAWYDIGNYWADIDHAISEIQRHKNKLPVKQIEYVDVDTNIDTEPIVSVRSMDFSHSHKVPPLRFSTRVKRRHNLPDPWEALFWALVSGAIIIVLLFNLSL